MSEVVFYFFLGKNIRLNAHRSTSAIREEKMAKKTKKLCKWKQKDISEKFEKFSDIVRNPGFVCAKCGRVAGKKKWLHKSVALR